jgi:UDP-N-acetylglucosamine 3-dehydrogenase
MKIGLLGAGGMGNVHARHYRNLPVEVGVFDLDSGLAKTLAERHGATVFESFDDLMGWCDAADLCVPNDLHARIGHQVVDAGKPFLIEKPITHDLDEAEALLQAAEAKGLSVMVGHVVRCFPEYRNANAMVKNGRLGRVAAVRMRRGGTVPRAAWFQDHSRSGGVLVDLAIHEFDWLRWTFGPVSHLFAKTVGATTDQGPDYGLCTITFQSGTVAHVEATWMDPAGFRTEFEICGSEGMIQFDSRQAASLRTHGDGSVRYESPLSATDDPYFRQLKGFTEALEGGEPMPVTGREGLEALRIAMAARESAKTGQVIHF